MEYKYLKLKNTEKAVFDMRELFEAYGYSQYKVSKFEEYDLYVQNKSFLVSDNILSFTDTTGKLMALKPDVTLSIVKNTKHEDGDIQKVYYSENVYRTLPGSQGFKEIMQTGLECIGEIDLYAMSEVLMLAAESLRTISEDFVLDISHMGFVAGLLDCGINASDQEKILSLVSVKNISELMALCSQLGIPERVKEAICTITSLYMPLEDALQKIREYVTNSKMADACEELGDILKILKLYGLDRKVYADFSMASNMNYYNGIIFKGFINGIPDGVLSGGRYDNLLWKIGKKTGAIGFAVYLDRLERFGADERGFDVDTLLVYDESVAAEDVVKQVELLKNEGRTVRAVHSVNENVKYRNIVKLGKGGMILG